MNYVNKKYLDDYLETDNYYNNDLKGLNFMKFCYKDYISRSLGFQMYQLKRSLKDSIHNFINLCKNK